MTFRFGTLNLRSASNAAYSLRKFSVPNLKVTDPKACQCGEVLKGQIKPNQCQVFGTLCTPETPMGALMVSSEGACAAYHQYSRITFVKREPASVA